MPARALRPRRLADGRVRPQRPIRTPPPLPLAWGCWPVRRLRARRPLRPSLVGPVGHPQRGRDLADAPRPAFLQRPRRCPRPRLLRARGTRPADQTERESARRAREIHAAVSRPLRRARLTKGQGTAGHDRLLDRREASGLHRHLFDEAPFLRRRDARHLEAPRQEARRPRVRLLGLRLQPPREVRLHLRPVVVDDRVVGGIANPGVDQHVLAEDALEARRQRLERAAGLDVARVRLELDAHRTRVVERLPEHQEFRLDVRAARPGCRAQPGIADLDAAVFGPERQVTRAAEHAAGVPFHGHEGNLALRRGFAYVARNVRVWHDRGNEAAAATAYLRIANVKRRETTVAVIRAAIAYAAFAVAIVLSAAELTGGLDKLTTLAGASFVIILAGFANQRVLMDVIAGTMLFVERWHAVGDTIAIPTLELQGIVEDVSLRRTRLRTLDGETIQVSNSQIPAVRVLPEGLKELAIELFVTDRESGENLVRAAQRILPEGPTTFARRPWIEEVNELDERLVRIRLRASVVAGREWLVEGFLSDLLKERADEGLIVHGPVVLTVDEQAARSFARASAATRWAARPAPQQT